VRAKAQGRISTVGRTSEEDVRNRRSLVPNLPGSHEAFGDGDRPKSIRRYLARVGEPTEPPERSPSGGPPFLKSVVLRQKMLGGADLGA